MKQRLTAWLLALLLAASLLTGCGAADDTAPTPAQPSQETTQTTEPEGETPEEPEILPEEPETPPAEPDAKPQETPASLAGGSFSMDQVPAYSGDAYVAVHDNVPYFTENELTAESFESYSPLDRLGRCGPAVASVGQDLMPTEERGSIGQVKPSGWQTVKYDIVDGKYLYNRCHLIGYQLTAENANEENLITGTRYLNIEGMLPFENLVADYVQETGSHVLYRVTPIFTGDNLVADGVLMEGWSVEDGGEGVCFCVFAYNVQPGVTIDYATGASRLSDADPTPEEPAQEPAEEPQGVAYVLNTNSKKFHYPDCSSVDDMAAENRQDYTGSRDDLMAQGYSACGRCKP